MRKTNKAVVRAKRDLSNYFGSYHKGGNGMLFEE